MAVAGLIVLMAVVTRMYRIAGPNRALIVTGFRGTRIVNGGRHRGTCLCWKTANSCRLS